MIYSYTVQRLVAKKSFLKRLECLSEVQPSIGIIF